MSRRRDLAVEDDPGGLLDVERDAGGAGEVVAGAERQQADHRALEVVAAVQCCDDGVQAAVAARDHDPPRSGPVQDAVELAGVRGALDLHGRAVAQHRQPQRELLVVGGAGGGVGDDEQRVHAAETIRGPGDRRAGTTFGSLLPQEPRRAVAGAFRISEQSTSEG